MKPHASLAILTVALLCMAATLFIVNSKRANRQKEEERIESARKGFLKSLGNQNTSIDSTYVHNDTLFFFSKGSFLGKSVISTD